MKTDQIIKRINYFIFRAKICCEKTRVAEMQSNRHVALRATDLMIKYESAALDLAKEHDLLSEENCHFNN